MQLDEGLGQGQTEPGPLIPTIEVAVDLAEWRQRLGNVIEGNADSGVGNLEHVAVFRVGPNSYGHHPTCRRELDRIRKQIDQNLLELALIGMKRRQIGRGVVLDLHAPLFSPFLDQGEARSKNPRHVDIFLMQLGLALSCLPR